MSKIITAMDFGTSKLACISVKAERNGDYEITGYSSRPYGGHSNGNWNKPDDLTNAVYTVLRDVESMSGRRIRNAYISVPGDFSEIQQMKLEMNVTASDRRVTKRDVQSILASANRGQFPGHTLIHALPVYYILDDAERIADPIGSRSNRINARVSAVFANDEFIRSVSYASERCGVNVKGFVSSTAANLKVQILPEERKMGCVLVDTGFATSTVSILLGDGILYQKTIPYGAKQIIVNLMKEMHVSFTEAENLKRTFVFGIDSDYLERNTMRILDKTDIAHRYEISDVTRIVEGSATEVLKAVNQCIGDSGYSLATRSKIFLTGGGLSKMSGIRQLASSVFSRSVQVIEANAPRIGVTTAYTDVINTVEYITKKY